MALYIVTWWKRKTGSNIKQVSKMGAEIMELERITITMTLMVEYQVKEALTKGALI